MKLTIGKKLTFSFLGLALLVLLSGGVGIMILEQVGQSGDIVAKEKAPTQYCVMKTDLSVEGIQRLIADYSLSFSGLAEKEKALLSMLDELDMWIAILEHGSSSEAFKKSNAYNTYKSLKLDIEVPQGSKELIKILSVVKQERNTFRQKVVELIQAHNSYAAYSYNDDGNIYDLPSYVLLIQQYISTWYISLESVVVSVTKFEKNTDPDKGPLGTWLNNYTLEDETFNKMVLKLKKYNNKLLTTAGKINEQKEFKGKEKFLIKNRANLARVNKYLEKINKHITPPFKQLRAVKREKTIEVNDSGREISSDLDQLIKIAEKEMSMALKVSEDAKRKGKIFLIGLTICAVAIALALGIYTSRYITRAITALADVTKAISQGELRNTVDITSRDELGELANDTNAMSKNLRKIIRQITNYSGQLTTSSTDLTGVAGAMSEGALMMTQRSESVAAAAEEMSANMHSVAAATEEAVTNINTVSIATTEINSSINQIAESSEKGNIKTQEAVNRAGSARKQVDKLGEAAKEINKVTEVISEISEQTNLLALNATIEAARAGEAGKGFAVVASEIKQLALQTAEATSDIKKRIEDIQKSTSGTVDEIRSVSQIIEEINSIVSTIAAAVEEQSATTKEISENMGQATNGLEEISENVAQSTTVASGIAEDIVEVNTSSNEVLSNSEHVNNNSVELKKLASDLKELINQFKL